MSDCKRVSTDIARALRYASLETSRIDAASEGLVFRFELFYSALEGFNSRFHVLVHLSGIPVVEFVHSVLPHTFLQKEAICLEGAPTEIDRSY